MKQFKGELIGTFILVFFGCGSVAISVIYDAFSLFDIAFIWCLAVTFGIFASRQYSDAHLNPAVSIAMLFAKKIKLKELLPYLSGQFTGAFLAALTLFALFNAGLTALESAANISRDSVDAVSTAKMFGEFYSHGGPTGEGISTLNAFFAEGLGTFFLVLMIFRLTTKENEHKFLTPFYIGFVVAAIICIIAPLTQAGLNPARDLAPRVFSYLAGWKSAAFSAPDMGWLTVYVVAPILGGIIAHYFNKFVLK
jgi:glycerol uptake facilitator protein